MDLANYRVVTLTAISGIIDEAGAGQAARVSEKPCSARLSAVQLMFGAGENRQDLSKNPSRLVKDFGDASLGGRELSAPHMTFAAPSFFWTR